MGMYEKAREHAKKALSMDPDNARLKSNLALIEDRCKKETSEEVSS